MPDRLKVPAFCNFMKFHKINTVPDRTAFLWVQSNSFITNDFLVKKLLHQMFFFADCQAPTGPNVLLEHLERIPFERTYPFYEVISESVLWNLHPYNEKFPGRKDNDRHLLH